MANTGDRFGIDKDIRISAPLNGAYQMSIIDLKAPNPNQDTSWNTIAKRYVVYLDIMGFKDMVARQDPETIYDMMLGVRTKIQVSKEIADSFHKKDLVRVTMYSDSITVISKDDSFDSLRAIMTAACTLTGSLLVAKIPHKGSIAHGTMAFNPTESIFFGQPLIDAYLLQDELLFYGIISHSSLEKRLDSFSLNEKRQLWHFSDYACPLKAGIANHLTIPAIHSLSKIQEDIDEGMTQAYERLTSSIKKLRFKTSGHLRKYIENTEKFYSTIRVGYNSLNLPEE